MKLELWESVIVFNNNFWSATNLCLRYAPAKCAGNSTFRGIVFCNLGTPKTVISISSQRSKLRPHMTDRSKTPHLLFGGRVLMDEKSGQNFLRSIFNSTHHFVLLCLDFLAVRMAFVRKRCGGKFGRSVLVDSSPKLIFGTSRYVKVL